MIPTNQYLHAPPYISTSYSNHSNHSLYGSMQDPTSATSSNAPQLLQDPNSPELFKANLRIVREDIHKLQALAQDVLSGIQYAFEPNHTPLTTETKTIQLKEELVRLIDRLRQTGIGALPLRLPSDTSPAPTEADLLASSLNNLKLLYDKLQKSHESAAVVANLVSPEYIAKSAALPNVGPVAMSTPSTSTGK